MYFISLLFNWNSVALLSVIGAAKESLVKLAEEKYKLDLVFIDADKTGYLEYYKVSVKSCE